MRPPLLCSLRAVPPPLPLLTLGKVGRAGRCAGHYTPYGHSYFLQTPLWQHHLPACGSCKGRAASYGCNTVGPFMGADRPGLRPGPVPQRTVPGTRYPVPRRLLSPSAVWTQLLIGHDIHGLARGKDSLRVISILLPSNPIATGAGLIVKNKPLRFELVPPPSLASPWGG